MPALIIQCKECNFIGTKEHFKTSIEICDVCEFEGRMRKLIVSCSEREDQVRVIKNVIAQDTTTLNEMTSELQALRYTQGVFKDRLRQVPDAWNTDTCGFSNLEVLTSLVPELPPYEKPHG